MYLELNFPIDLNVHCQQSPSASGLAKKQQKQHIKVFWFFTKWKLLYLIVHITNVLSYPHMVINVDCFLKLNEDIHNIL